MGSARNQRTIPYTRLLLLAVVPLAAGCASAAPTASKNAADAPASASVSASATEHSGAQRGIASYYADSLRGRPTASGEPYDPTALTAAHRTLPFGTLVEVRRGEQKVVVRINDRGPFGRKKRILDLSRRAAEELGMIRAGVAEVQMTVLRQSGGK